MSFSIGASGVWKAVPGAWIGVSGAWKLILNMHVGASSAWKLWFSALTATLSTDTVSGNCNRATAGSCTASTSTTTLTISGGSGSYSVSWALVSGTAASTNLVSLVTNWTRSAAATNPVNVLVGVYRCTVTDTVTGASVVAGDVTVTTRHTLSV